MKFCISCGKLELKYFFFYTLIGIIELYINIVIYYDQDHKNIFNRHLLLNSLCFFIEYLLNIIPVWLNNRNYDNYDSDNKYLSTKDIIQFFFICFILLLTEIIDNILIIIKINEIEEYEDHFTLMELLMIFLLSKFKKEAYYMHQNISFLIIILVEIVKIIYFLFNKNPYQLQDIFIFVLNIIYSFFILFIIYI